MSNIRTTKQSSFNRIDNSDATRTQTHLTYKNEENIIDSDDERRKAEYRSLNKDDSNVMNSDEEDHKNLAIQQTSPI